MKHNEFFQLKKYFGNNQFPEIEADLLGSRWLKLRTISRKSDLLSIAETYSIDIGGFNANQAFEALFYNPKLTEKQIDKYIQEKYNKERAERRDREAYLVDQLNRLSVFDWGGSRGNSLEKNIVNNYVKKIQSFDTINEAIEGPLFHSLKGYTLNSWYNHWTSILIEDIFKDHANVLPTVGLVKKIDFFIGNVPFDLKVTYFPEQLLRDELKNLEFGNELTETKKVCRSLKITIPKDLKDDELKLHLQRILNENNQTLAKEFLSNLKLLKTQIIEKYRKNPHDLMVWFYENQGEMRFDASNRFFLVLINDTNFTESWKIKRNIQFLRENIHRHLDEISSTNESMDIEFYWAKSDQHFKCKSDIQFINYNTNEAL